MCKVYASPIPAFAHHISLLRKRQIPLQQQGPLLLSQLSLVHLHSFPIKGLASYSRLTISCCGCRGAPTQGRLYPMRTLARRNITTRTVAMMAAALCLIWVMGVILYTCLRKSNKGRLEAICNSYLCGFSGIGWH